MILRRKRDSATDETPDETAAPGPRRSADPLRAEGPWDASELDVEDVEGYVSLGGLSVKPAPGLQVQVPADPKSGKPTAVVFTAEGAAVELRAFAAARSGGVWDEVRSDIVTEAERREGEITEVEGRHGAELRLRMPARLPDGQAGVQPSRIVGVEGPRWLLRATFYGKAAVEPDDDGVLETAVRDVVVNRGAHAMPPREPIPIELPTDLVRVDESGARVSDEASEDAAADADGATDEAAADATEPADTTATDDAGSTTAAESTDAQPTDTESTDPESTDDGAADDSDRPRSS